MSARERFQSIGHPSAAAGRAMISCPLCEGDAIAEVDGSSDERGSHATLERFECENGHNEDHLTRAEERSVLESALDWLSEAREAMEGAYWDDRHDRMRDDGY